jgi:hypothetical protein
LQQRHVGQGENTIADLALQERPADDDGFKPAVRAQLPAAVLVPEEVSREVAADGACGDQLVHHARKIIRQDLIA